MIIFMIVFVINALLFGGGGVGRGRGKCFSLTKSKSSTVILKAHKEGSTYVSLWFDFLFLTCHDG